MKVLDANVALRYVLHDNEEMYKASAAIISSERCMVFPEVVAEVVYVLSYVYKLQRNLVVEGVYRLLNDVDCEREDAVKDAMRLFNDTRLDFVDCLLVSYHKLYGWEIITFDKKMARRMKNSGE